MIYSCSEADIGFRLFNKASLKDSQKEDLIKSNELLFVSVLEGGVELSSGFNNTSYILESGECISLFYPMQNWSTNLKLLSDETEVFFLKINLVLFHELLSGEKDAALKRILLKPDFYGANSFNGKKMVLSPLLKLTVRQVSEMQVGLNTLKPYIRAKIVELFSLLLDSREPASPTQACPFFSHSEIRKRMMEVRDFLTLNPDEEKALTHFSEEFDMSKHALKVGFKRTFDKHIKDFCLEIRMDKALEMLQAGGVKVSDVAYQTGYSNPSHFISLFKKRYGSSPGSFLKVKEH